MTVALRNGARVPDGDAFELGIRPEHAVVTEAVDPAAVMTGRINMLERLGNATMLYVETERGVVVVEADSESPARIGDAVGVKLDAERSHLFAADGNVV